MPTDVLDRFDDSTTSSAAAGTRVGANRSCPWPPSTRKPPSALAEILDGASGIEWWLRLQTNDPAYVELDTGGKYNPDFIAVDTSGVHWLIEGKSDHDVARRDVEAKRAAAEEWATFVNDVGRFGVWRYLFCSETTIKNARGGWDSLLVAAHASG
jgi:type III restriction enzyme